MDPLITIRGENIKELQRRLRESQGLSVEDDATTHEITDIDAAGKDDEKPPVREVWDKEYLARLDEKPLSASARQFGEVLDTWRASGRPMAPAAAASGVLPPTDTTTHAAERRSEHAPPLAPEYLLYVLIPRKYRIPLAGDLREEYASDILPRFGRRRAQLWYVQQVLGAVLRFLPRTILKAVGLIALARQLRTLLQWLIFG
jgi:hypothetical protein